MLTRWTGRRDYLALDLGRYRAVAAACGGDDDGSGSSVASDPAAVIEGYVAAYNTQDIDRVMAFFADDAVIIEGAERIEGAEAIRADELEQFTVHASGGDRWTELRL